MKQTNILILEDDPIRHEAFRKNFIGAEIRIVDNVPDAIEELKHNSWDYLFLDHDLGGTTFAPSDEHSGYGVAKFLETNPQYAPNRIFTHSLNPTGRNNINSALPQAVQAPFAWMQVLIFNKANND